MPETAEAHAVSITTNRNCVIEITNVTASICLVHPKVYMDSGYVHSPPQPTLRTPLTEVCSFTKDDNTASGAVGVLTYELFDMHKRQATEVLAVMFSVPFDYNIFKNWLAVGIFDRSTPCDEKLYKRMYEDKECTSFVRHEADGSGVTYKGSRQEVRGCMSDEGRAIIKLEVYDKMF